jgi:hypothetical protein
MGPLYLEAVKNNTPTIAFKVRNGVGQFLFMMFFSEEDDESRDKLYSLFRIVISASREADFPMIPCESALLSSSCALISPRVVPCHVPAKASVPQAPWGMP